MRWAVHRAMWRASPLRKVRDCRRVPHADVEDLPVRVLRREDGGVDVGVGGLQTCATWHSCMTCGAKISLHRAAELEHIFRIWRALGGSVVMATFTCRHHRGHTLAELVAGQRAGWEAVRSDRPWQADLAALGVAELDQLGEQERVLLAEQLKATTDREERRALKRQLRKTRGIIRAFEATHGDEHGWHPHYHTFFLVEGSDITTEQARAALAPAWDRWCEGLAAHGLDAVGMIGGESAGFDVRVLGEGDEASRELALYPFKLALEAVGGVFKRGRDTDAKGKPLGSRHRTPFEVMEHVALADALGADDKQAREDRAVITEWSETASAMRFRQCPLPPGMRAWFAQKAAELHIPGPLLEEELSEEQMAKAEAEGTETAGHMPWRSWLGGGQRVDDATDQAGDRRQLTAGVAYELDTLKAAGRCNGVTGLVAWFGVRGIDFLLSDTGRELLAQERRQRARQRHDDKSGSLIGCAARARASFSQNP